MIYNIIGGIVNVALNYILIYGHMGFPEMRADGAALATTISKFVSLEIALCILLFKDTEINLKHGIDKGFAWSTASATQTATTVMFGRSLGEGNEKKQNHLLYPLQDI